MRFSSVQSLSFLWLFATTWTAVRKAFLSFINSWSLPKLVSIESVMPSNHIIHCCPLILLISIFPSIRVFTISQFFASGGQSIGASASTSVLAMNIQDWSPLEWTGWISLQSKGLSRVFSNTTVKNINSSVFSFLYSPSLTSIMTTVKTTGLTRWTFIGKIMSLLFNMLSMLVITFLPRSKHLLISWLQSPSAVIFEPQKIKFFTVSIFFPSICPWSDGTRCHVLTFLNVEF